MRSLTITATLSAALCACSPVDNVLYGAREGTMEYPGSAAGPDAVATYVVRNKDTVDGIAHRYGVSSHTIIERNRLQAPYSIRPGQTLLVPGAKYVAPEMPVQTASTTATATATANPGGPPGGVRRESLPPPPGASEAPKDPKEEKSASLAPPPQHAAGEPTPLAPKAATAPPPGPAPRFQWPLRGKVITGYGTHGGQKSDGIDIAADKGAPVKAADGGTVVYSGDGVPHLGNLLLVEHPGGYITAYGNNEALLVKKGDKVGKGQTIAKAGSSGGVPTPRLHFEVRRGGAKTIDPMSVLPAP
jgi:murein DD-endopeptidase MepM/ murein hydrolase activator NlpD